MKQEIQIAAKMYRCQEMAKSFFKDEYSKKIQWYMDTLKMVMIREYLSELNAVLLLSKLDSVKDNGMAIMMFMAAAVEVIESKEVVQQ